ncbi:MAG TPA: glycine/sarcosine/betaine reductase selenoprotein B family protein [Chloroflexota bacterium]|nr:glycine/sarcosine/betaine reductase selenoprotein B family protein [Chloroflexota bacterium]
MTPAQARKPFSYIDFMSKLLAPRPYGGASQPNFDPPALAPLRKPVAQSIIGVFTSAGLQLPSEPLLEETNDLSYRLIDRDTPLSDLIVAHKTPVRVWAVEDANVAYPRDRLVELEQQGEIGKLAPKAVSMVGSITRFSELVADVVPKIKQEFDDQGVDLVLVYPF